MVERILVPLDDSEFSQRILPIVTDLAKQTGASVLLLTVVAQPDRPGGPGVSQAGGLIGAAGAPRASAGQGLSDPVTTGVDRANKESMEAIARPLRAAGITAETEVLFGDDVVDRVKDAVDAHDIDLIALSTHARTGLARTLMGSVAERLLREANKPVLLIRPQGA